MTLIDLKPCPFDCGATKEGKHPEIGQSNSTFAFHVYCSWCGVEGEAHEIEQDAITAWNARAQQQEPLAWLDSPETLEALSRAAHEAKLKICYSWMDNDCLNRESWKKPNVASPNQPWHDVAYAQGKAIIQTIKQLAKSKTNDSEGV